MFTTIALFNLTIGFCNQNKTIMKTLLISIAILLSGTFFTQTPGNVGTANLTGWFLPDNLPNGDVTSWTTAYPTAANAITVNDVAPPYALATNTPAGNVSNYNTTIEFTNNTYASLKGFQNTASLNLLDNNSVSSAEGTFFNAYYLPTFTSNNHMMIYNESGSDGIQVRNLGAKGRIAIGANTYVSTLASRDWFEDFTPSIVSYRGNRSSSTSMESFYQSDEFVGGVASQSSGNTGLYFGYRPTTTNSAYNGYLHEFIFFNRDLTDVEMRRVNTYLAIKYGVTLVNTGGGAQGDYESTNGSLVWDASNGSSYHHDVVGLARDDAQGLLQKQSHAFDDSTRIYIDNLSAHNQANTGTFVNDNSYIMIGHNDDLNCSSLASIAEVPSGFNIVSRLAREWKITKTNFAQDFNLDLTLNQCTNPTAADIANLKLLIDTDGDFTNALVVENGSGVNISYANGVFTIQDLDNTLIPDNSTSFITIGFEQTDVQVASNINTICVGESIQLIFSSSNAVGTFDAVYTDGVNNYTLSNISNGHMEIVTPTVSTTYSIVSAQPFLNCCSAPVGVTDVIITVNSIPVVVANSSSMIFCEGDSVSIFGSGASTYQWSPVINDNAYFIPTASGTYTVTGTDVNGCIASDDVSITMIDKYPLFLGNDTTICPQAPLEIEVEDIFSSYEWQNGSQDPYYSVSNGGTYYLTVIDANNCSYSDTITVDISDKCSETLYVPNVFTPNGDNLNETFYVYGLGIDNYEIQIYNRWGNLVYESIDIEEEWNGTTQNGMDAPTGVYVYVISYRKDGSADYRKAQGHITIMR